MLLLENAVVTDLSPSNCLVFNPERQFEKVPTADTSEKLNKSGSRSLKNSIVERLWNTARADHQLEGGKKLFPVSFELSIFLASLRGATTGSRKRTSDN